MQAAAVRVPASTSNLGAGFDAIGLALDRYLTARYERGAGELRVERRGTLARLAVSPDEDVLVRAFRTSCRRRGLPEPRGWLVADSGIPVARGLGSSAAAVVAGLALAAAATAPHLPDGDTAGPGEMETGPGEAEAAHGIAGFDRQAALREAEALEGHPDNAAPALLGGLVGVARDGAGRAGAFRLPLSPAIAFAFAAPGLGVATAEARAALPAAVPHALAARGLGRVAALVRGLETADPELLRLGFSDELHMPYRLPLIPGAAAALAAAQSAGAWAATISGSGSGLIAACPAGQAAAVAEAMAAAFRDAVREGEVIWFAASPDLEGLRFLTPV
ncbi:MAG: homoserine kinase [Gemmatimonadetes bacterium]|nr:homoserine kinase [Gemmatimonadota bacterium]